MLTVSVYAFWYFATIAAPAIVTNECMTYRLQRNATGTTEHMFRTLDPRIKLARAILVDWYHYKNWLSYIAKQLPIYDITDIKFSLAFYQYKCWDGKLLKKSILIGRQIFFYSVYGLKCYIYLWRSFMQLPCLLLLKTERN